MPADMAGCAEEILTASVQATSMHEPLTVNASLPVSCKQSVGINKVKHIVLLTTSNENSSKQVICTWFWMHAGQNCGEATGQIQQSGQLSLC